MNTRGKLIAFQTILTKEVLRFARIWVQTVLPPAITMALYFVIFGKLIGAQIGDMDGVRYVDFIVPGLILMAVISNSYANVVASFYSSKFQHNIEELLIAPLPDFIILSGYVAGGVARGVVVGSVVTAVSMFFSDLQIHSYGVTLAVFVLTSVLFSIAGFINAVYANSFDDISIVPTFVLTPLTYLGGVFYSISMLPDFWRQLSLVNPVLYMVNAFRYGLLGVSDIAMWQAFAIILGFIIALGAFAMWLLARGVGIKS
jgi:ABC-2 type transport system permease protein